MMPRRFPNGSTTEAVMNHAPRSVAAWCSCAPIASKLLECCSQIVDVPVHDRTGRAGRRRVGRVAAIDQAQLVLVVAEAKLGISRALEVSLDAQQLGVPLLRRHEISRPKTDGGESSQHLCCFRRREYLSASPIVRCRSIQSGSASAYRS